MTVAKRFRWEAAHRLPWHEGPCDNLHGHSYRMTVELEGTPDARGMLVDFQDVKQALKPLVDAWDHAILVAETDRELRQIVEQTGWKHAVLPCDTTAENLSAHVAEHLCTEAGAMLRANEVEIVRVRLAETETCYAEAERRVAAHASTDDRRREALAE
ncbi:MAG: 6-carboxytetrahydropterin synthase [Bacteroidetes bacterium]|jgi:6-pyruvoyltetrahydropterin/6-carboxytetrahydropterin synthase|nr:6-carboxytetrahydropterin synthase [Bacteroidota bacterium]